MSWKKCLGAVAVIAVMGMLLQAEADKAESSAVGMSDAATKFLESLTPEQAAMTKFGFDDPERLNWHFIPRPRKGLPLKALEGQPLRNAHALIQSGLSKNGYDQALNVMSLEELLYLLEDGEREYRRDRRDPQKYYLSVFGKPSNSGKWGWRLEGHHISLNYTIEDGQLVSTTPEFYGANPGFVDAGPGRSIRVLAPEEDLARQILKLCNPEQLKICWIDEKAPDEVRGAGVAQPEVTDPVGLKAGAMSKDQRNLLADLLNEYLKNMPTDVEKQRRAELEKAGMDDIYFAWWGEQDRNQRHHYRVQGPTFIIEYNNTQNSANHVHSMWRNVAGDFAISRSK